MRSIYLHKDKSIFQIDELPAERFAESLGLPGMPRIKFLSKEMAKKKKNASRAVANIQAEAKAAAEAEGENDSGDEDLSEHSSSEEEESGEIEVTHDEQAEQPKVSVLGITSTSCR